MNLGIRSRLFAALMAGLCAQISAPAYALNIIATFDSASFGATSNAANAMAAVNTAVSTINALYTSPGSSAVPVLFVYNSALGGGGSSSSAISTISYATYRNALSSDLAANPSNTQLATALGTGGSLPATLSQSIEVTAVWSSLIRNRAMSLCFNSAGTFVSGCAQQYAAVISVSTGSDAAAYYASPGSGFNSSAVSVAEHELNEILGGGGPGTTIGTGSTALGILDLYRYASTGTGCTTATGLSGTRSYTTSTSAIACFSIDGGKTAILDQQGNPIQFNQAGGGSDYADYKNTGDANIQNAYVPSVAAYAYTTKSAEFQMMRSIGYNISASAAAVPEPASWMTMLMGFGLVGGGLRRRKSYKAGKPRQPVFAL